MAERSKSPFEKKLEWLRSQIHLHGDYIREKETAIRQHRRWIEKCQEEIDWMLDQAAKALRETEDKNDNDEKKNTKERMWRRGWRIAFGFTNAKAQGFPVKGVRIITLLEWRINPVRENMRMT